MRAVPGLAVFVVLGFAVPAQQVLRDIHVGETVGAVTLSRVGEASGRLLFQRGDSNEAGLWVTDGTEAGTGLVMPGLLIVSDSAASTGAHNFFVTVGCDGLRQLWRSDGTRQGTAVVVDVDNARHLTAYRHGVCFVDSDSTGDELWWSDGTSAGTSRVADLLPGPAGSLPSDLVAVGHKVMFRATDASGARVLWETDATAAGTRAVTATPVLALARLGDALAYVTQVGSDMIVRLYDPAAAQHRDLLRMPTNPEAFRAFATTDAAIYFTRPAAFETEVMMLDPTGSLTRVHFGAFSFGNGLQTASDAAFFTAFEAGRWRIFGSLGGPAVALLDANGFDRRWAGVLGKRLIFGTREGVYGTTFISDGTAAGTQRLSDLGPGRWLGALGVDAVVGLGTVASSSLIRVAGDSGRASRIAHWKPTRGADSTGRPPAVGVRRALFVANDSLGLAVYSTDGAPKGTHELARGDAPEFVMGPERGYFASGTRLYTTLGTPGTTRLLRDFTPYGVRGLVARGDDLMAFFARRGADELVWVSGGGVVYQIPFSESYVVANGLPFLTETATYVLVSTSAGLTSLQRNAAGALHAEAVASLGPDAMLLGRLPGRLVLLEGGALVVYDEIARTLSRPGVSPPMQGGVLQLGARLIWVGTSGIWATDGTLAGSAWVTHQTFSSPTVAADKLFVVGVDAQAGAELWVSDGTLPGTVRVADIEPGPCSSAPQDLAPAGNGRQVVFSAHTSARGREMWTSDGTAAGTRLVADLVSPGSSNPRFFAVLGSQTIFWARHPVVGEEPWTMPTAQLGAHVVRSLGGCPRLRTPLSAFGAPRLGNASFAFVARPVPLSDGVLLLGTTIVAQAYYGCLQRVGDVVARVPARASGGGELRVGVPIPNDPRVLGLTFVAQYQLTQSSTSVTDALYCTVGR